MKSSSCWTSQPERCRLQVDAATTAASTPLAAAAGQGHTQVVRALLLAGATVDTQAQNGSTPLHSAASGGHAECVLELTAADCDLDIQNSNSNTALHVAAAKGAFNVSWAKSIGR